MFVVMPITLHPATFTDLYAPSPALAAGLAQGFVGDEPGGRTALSEALTAMTADAGTDPFGVYWAQRGDTIVGLCSFKGGPDADGAVEIAYYVFPDFERQQIGRRMAEALVLIAWQAGAAVVTARTLPHESASTSILARLGFTRLDDVDDPEDGPVWAWGKAL